jgi:hypothetical protein
MKIASFVKAAVSVAFCGALTSPSPAQKAAQSPWVGVWTSLLNGQPGVTMTLAQDGDQLGGTIVFYVVMGPPQDAHVGGKAVLMVQHPRLEGDKLLFEVTRSSDGKILKDELSTIDSDNLELACLNCGEEPSKAVLVRSHP